MTEQVRRGYRNHRGAAWGVVLAVGVVLAAIAIPLATGAAAADKTYKLTISPSTTTCASPATTTVTIKNTGSPQTLGSAEIYFPPNTVASVSTGQQTLRVNKTSTTSNGPKDILALDNIGLVPNASKAIDVTFKAGISFSATINAVAKQSNRFNDSGGGANLFTHDGAFPTLRVVQCVEVSGRVYQDRNLDNGYVTGDGAFDNSDIPKAWTVKLYAKEVGAPASSYAVVGTVTADAAGAYTFSSVPTLSDYKLCVSVPGTDPDDDSKWGLQSPTGNAECGPISTAVNGPSSSAGKLFPNLAAGATSPSTDFQVVPVVGPFGAADTSPVGGYTVTASTNSTKADDFYVQDTWVDSQGRTNFRFSPINPCGQSCPSGKIYLLETLIADIDLDKLGGQQVSLMYDDVAPFLDGDLKPMPYCDIDPRQSGGSLATSGVLPGNATSCIVAGTQSVVAGGEVHAEYQVYTSYDGGRQVG